MNPSTPAPFPYPPDAPVLPPHLGDIALPDLLHGIGEGFAHDFQHAAPDAYAALMHLKVAAAAGPSDPAPLALSQPAPVHHPVLQQPMQQPSPRPQDFNPAPSVPINEIFDHFLTATPAAQQHHLQNQIPVSAPLSAPVPAPVPVARVENVRHAKTEAPIQATAPTWPQQPQPFPYTPVVSQPTSILRRPSHAPDPQPIPHNSAAAAAAAVAAAAAAAAAAASSSTSSLEGPPLHSAPLPTHETPHPLAHVAHAQAAPLAHHPHIPVTQQPLLHVKQQPQLVVDAEDKPIISHDDVMVTSALPAHPPSVAAPVPAPVQAPSPAAAPAPAPTPFVERTTHVRFASRVNNSEPSNAQLSSDSIGAPGQGAEGEDDQEQRKAMRAERNRQSAAASRERRKHYIKELERRVAVLSKENATLQCGQLSFIRERLDEESRLVAENNDLRKDIEEKNSAINVLAEKLAGLNTSTKKHSTTWDGALWRRRGASLPATVTRPHVKASASGKE